MPAGYAFKSWTGHFLSPTDHQYKDFALLGEYGAPVAEREKVTRRDPLVGNGIRKRGKHTSTRETPLRPTAYSPLRKSHIPKNIPTAYSTTAPTISPLQLDLALYADFLPAVEAPALVLLVLGEVRGNQLQAARRTYPRLPDRQSSACPRGLCPAPRAVSQAVGDGVIRSGVHFPEGLQSGDRTAPRRENPPSLLRPCPV